MVSVIPYRYLVGILIEVIAVALGLLSHMFAEITIFILVEWSFFQFVHTLFVGPYVSGYPLFQFLDCQLFLVFSEAVGVSRVLERFVSEECPDFGFVVGPETFFFIALGPVALFWKFFIPFHIELLPAIH